MSYKRECRAGSRHQLVVIVIRRTPNQLNTQVWESLHYVVEKMERETGIEPVTSSLGSGRSTSLRFTTL